MSAGAAPGSSLEAIRTSSLHSAVNDVHFVLRVRPIARHVAGGSRSKRGGEELLAESFGEMRRGLLQKLSNLDAIQNEAVRLQRRDFPNEAGAGSAGGSS